MLLNGFGKPRSVRPFPFPTKVFGFAPSDIVKNDVEIPFLIKTGLTGMINSAPIRAKTLEILG
jgi:hypothetical protein